MDSNGLDAELAMTRRPFALARIASITLITWLLPLGAIAATAGCRRDKSAAANGARPTTIAVVPKGTTHEFWKAVHAGAARGGKELGAEIVWKGPMKEDDLKSQVDIVQSFAAQGVSGIVLAPLNDKALQGPVRQAAQAKVPVVIFDSDLQGGDYSSFVATDNRVAGRMAGDHMAKLLGESGNVVVLRYQEGSASTANREEGFLDAIRAPAHNGITVVSSNQYGGATTESAFAISESLLAAHKGEKGIQGVFCPNESTTFGMLLALRKGGLAKKLRFIGFDSSDKLVQGVRDGDIDALVLQDPFNMGYLAVKTMIGVLRGEPVPKRIDTGSKLFTKANADQPEMQALLHPDLAKWLP